MAQKYQTRAREVWTEFLGYNEEEKGYIFLINFMYGNWREPNMVAFIFDEKGKYKETKAYIFHLFRNCSLGQTKDDHVAYSMKFKELAESLIALLVKPIKTEHIKLNEQSTLVNDMVLKMNFTLEKWEFDYFLRWNIIGKDMLKGRLIDESDEQIFIQVDNVPSLKEVRAYLLNHPTIRVKYINELARNEQNLKGSVQG